MIRTRPLLLPLALLGLASVVCAQARVRIAAPVGGVGGLSQPDASGNEFGVPVEMFENPNLDRYLRRAQDFLARDDYDGAIEVLQDVVEGRTVEAVDAPEGPEGEARKERRREGDVDARHAVFSENGRLYRPVRRLCQELLATMPTLGIELYRQKHEVGAGRMLDAALAASDLHGYEQVFQRYFVTLAAGRAMEAAGDTMLNSGRFRGAIQVYRDLLELYPQPARRQIGISDVYTRFKIALSLRMLGEQASALDEVQAMAQEYPDESIRLMGELIPVSGLPGSALFGSGEDSAVARVVQTASDPELFVIRTGREELVPLWEFRFEDPRPYRDSGRSTSNSGNFVIQQGGVAHTAPYAKKYGVGTSIAFLPGGFPPEQVAFMDHYRLRVHDALSGLMRQEGDGPKRPTPPRAGQPRARVPVYDFGALRVVQDEQRFYTVLGHKGARTSDLTPLTDNHLVAYDRETMRQLWSAKDWQEGELGLRDVTFLAVPTLFGERLLAPVLRRGAYGLQCLDRNTGEPLWRVKIHAGGTRMVRAPGSPVQVHGGIAYVLTNAGGVAAVDAFTGDLRWIRKYERRHPLREQSAPSAVRRNVQRGGRTFAESNLEGFITSEMLVVDGLVIFAPSDGDVVHCLDGATGEPVWMFSGSVDFAPNKALLYLVGANTEYLYLAGEFDLMCVGLRSGVRQWFKRLPADDAVERYRGRGAVTEDLVLIPGSRELLLLPADGSGNWQRLPLPDFTVGREPLGRANNLFVEGPFLAVTYEGGIELYSSKAALTGLAEASADPLVCARYLAHAGELRQAIDVLEQWLASGAGDAERRSEAAGRMMNLARELALAVAAHGERDDATQLLERVRPFAQDREVRLNWHLARLDLFQLLQDLQAYEREQQDLYRYMEGKG